MSTHRFDRYPDLDFAPCDARGGMGKMYPLFGDQMDSVVEEFNGGLVA